MKLCHAKNQELHIGIRQARGKPSDVPNYWIGSWLWGNPPGWYLNRSLGQSKRGLQCDQEEFKNRRKSCSRRGNEAELLSRQDPPPNVGGYNSYRVLPKSCLTRG